MSPRPAKIRPGKNNRSNEIGAQLIPAPTLFRDFKVLNENIGRRTISAGKYHRPDIRRWPAIFFVLGENVDEHEAGLRAGSDAGYAIGLHGFRHQAFETSEITAS